MIENKKCSCSTRNIRKWTHKLRSSRRQRARIQRKIRLEKRRLAVSSSKIALKACAECSADKKLQIQAQITKAQSKLIITEERILSERRREMKKVAKNWRSRAQACKNAESIIVRGKDCECTVIKKQAEIVSIRKRQIALSSRKNKLRSRILECKLNKEITTTVNGQKQVCACTSGKLTRWRLKINRINKRKRTLKSRSRKLKLRLSQRKIRVLTPSKRICKNGNTYVLIKSREVSCKEINRKFRRHMKKVRSIRKRQIKSAKKSLERTEKTLSANCEDKGAYLVSKNWKTRCNRLSRRIAYYKNLLSKRQTALKLASFKSRARRCRDSKTITIRTKSGKSQLECTTANRAALKYKVESLRSKLRLIVKESSTHRRARITKLRTLKKESIGKGALFYNGKVYPTKYFRRQLRRQLTKSRICRINRQSSKNRRWIRKCLTRKT